MICSRERTPHQRECHSPNAKIVYLCMQGKRETHLYSNSWPWDKNVGQEIANHLQKDLSVVHMPHIMLVS